MKSYIQLFGNNFYSYADIQVFSPDEPVLLVRWRGLQYFLYPEQIRFKNKNDEDKIILKAAFLMINSKTMEYYEHVCHLDRSKRLAHTSLRMQGLLKHRMKLRKDRSA